MNTSIPFTFQDSRSGTAVINSVLGIVERVSDEGMAWFRKGGIIHRTEKRKGVFVSIGVKLVENDSWTMPRLVECDWETDDSETPDELAVQETIEHATATEEILTAVAQRDNGSAAISEVLAGK